MEGAVYDLMKFAVGILILNVISLGELAFKDLHRTW